MAKTTGRRAGRRKRSKSKNKISKNKPNPIVETTSMKHEHVDDETMKRILKNPGFVLLKNIKNELSQLIMVRRSPRSTNGKKLESRRIFLMPNGKGRRRRRPASLPLAPGFVPEQKFSGPVTVPMTVNILSDEPITDNLEAVSIKMELEEEPEINESGYPINKNMDSDLLKMEPEEEDEPGSVRYSVSPLIPPISEEPTSIDIDLKHHTMTETFPTSPKSSCQVDITVTENDDFGDPGISSPPLPKYDAPEPAELQPSASHKEDVPPSPQSMLLPSNDAAVSDLEVVAAQNSSKELEVLSTVTEPPLVPEHKSESTNSNTSPTANLTKVLSVASNVTPSPPPPKPLTGLGANWASDTPKFRGVNTLREIRSILIQEINKKAPPSMAFLSDFQAYLLVLGNRNWPFLCALQDLLTITWRVRKRLDMKAANHRIWADKLVDTIDLLQNHFLRVYGGVCYAIYD